MLTAACVVALATAVTLRTVGIAPPQDSAVTETAPFPAPSNTVRLGTNATNALELDSTLAAMGRRTISWNVTYMADDAAVDIELLDAAAARGVRHFVITIEFWSLKGQHATLLNIARGAVDGNLRAIAQHLQAWQSRHPSVELIVRPLHEANLPSYPWGFGEMNKNGNVKEDFAPAWYRIWRVMRDEFPRLKFFLCPNGGDEESYDWGVPPSRVDYVGHDLYNQSQRFGTWMTPGEVHDGTIRAIQQVYPGKPYVIAETATSEPGSGVTGFSKAEWFMQLASWMRTAAARGVIAVCYFDHDKSHISDERSDWRIHPVGRPGAEDSRQAFQENFADHP
jgi:beta-mannanase